MVSASDSHSCALMNGGVQCWGSNLNGQIGNGTALDEVHTAYPVNTSVQTPLVGVTAIAAGSNHNCAAVDGGVSCWGLNSSGQLGVDSTANAAFAVAALPPGSGVTSVAAGGNFTCASSGVLTWCWGNGYNGRLGNGSLGYSVEFVIADSLFRDGFEND